ncbi:acyloxyacyl hydrolase [Aurantibacillus circumpalustris]|uniref:acyloxyacyl hydrolase n=1 Tax=Aurantibacillus circumpalustris TaxID=3036359 RepID=UPI00295AB949|nr:acyloxyacyl hydrolase [Aurantibacillus circumpalustris]
MLKKRTVCALLSILIVSVCVAQNGITSNPDWQIKPAISPGFVLVHRSTIGHLIKGYPTNYEINISKPTLGNKLWHHENNMPDIGLSLQCLDFKNPSQLGYALTVAPYIEIPLNEKEKRSRLVIRLCFGATYITKSFDIKTNHKNIAIGSHVNAFVQFKGFWQFKLSKALRFEPGFIFTHASNGKAKNPNLGLNVLSLNMALNILMPSTKPKPEIIKVDSSTKAKSKNEIMAFAAIGFNQRNIATKDLKCYVVSLTYQRNVRNTHKFSVGFDLFYDENYQIDYENTFLRKPTGFEGMRMSARLGYSYNVGRISFPIELGYYVFQKTQPDANIVSRIGVRYYSRSGLIVHFGLRTHFAVAYDFEYGLGYRFFLK